MSRPRLLVTLAFLAALGLSLPSVGVGYFFDDHVHRYALQGFHGPASGLSLFDFTPRVQAELPPYIQAGPYPWWTSPTLRVRFFRPLTSALMQLEHRVLGERPALAHLHSVAWYLALVGAAWLVLRRLLPGATGAFALCLYAVAESHWMPTVWLANRNALVATVPALLGFAAHLRWRLDGWRAGAVLSALGYATGLCGAEAALGTLALPVAWELLAAPGSRRTRALALVPVTATVLVFAVVYKLGAYGAHSSGMYLDPATDPAAWLAAAPARLLALLGSLLVNAPVDLWHPTPEVIPYLLAESAAGVLLVGWLAWRARGALAPDEARTLRFFAGGAVLALLPALSIFPASRLALPASLVGTGLLAVVARDLLRRRSWVFLGLLALTHLVLPVVFWVGGTVGFATMAREVDHAVRSAELENDRAGLRVIMPTSPDPSLFLYLPIQREVEGMATPRSWWVLSLVRRDVRLRRTGPASLELEIVGGRLLDGVFEQVLRSVDEPFAVGDQVALDGGRVEVIAVDRGHPTRLRLTTDFALDDESVRVIVWRDGALRRLVLPPVGEEILLPYQRGPAKM